MSLTGANIDLEVGSIVAGKFRIERMLAEGGMGLVVAATHLQLEQTVALKFFRGDLGTTGEPLMRFMREARAAAQLKSEYVARVLDVGVTEEGTPYMVMEYLEGQGVERVIAAEGPIDVLRAVEYAIEACEGLAEAHARGIVHRDIKPSNLFLTERSPGWRAIKILDFGISKVSLARASNITTSLNIVMGTPCYMSPEQFQSAANVDHRTDIWSLGATLYEMLSGKAPFDPSLPLLAIAEAIVNTDVPALHQVRPDVPQELSDIIARCISKDREQRIPSAAALAMALLPFAPPRSRATAERAAAMTPAFGLQTLEPRVTAHEGTDTSRTDSSDSTPNLKSGVMWTQIGFASPTPPTTGENALVLPPPVGDASALTTGISPVDRRGSMASRGWQSSSLLVVISASILVCAVVYLALVRATPPPRRSVSSLTSVSSPTATATPPSRSGSPGSAVPTMSELVVRVSPPSAQIMIDGSMVPGNPFRGHLHRGTHQIQAFAAGYEPKVQQASLATDVVLDFSLDRRTKSSSPRPASVGQPRSQLTQLSSASSSSLGAQSRQSGRTPPARQGASSRSAEVLPPRVPGPRPPMPSSSEIVDVRGGHAPLHPIETRSPYVNP